MVIGETRTWWMTVRLAEVCSGQMVRGEGHRHRGILRVDGGEAPPYRWHIKPYPNNVDSFQIKAEIRTKSANVPAAIYLAVFVLSPGAISSGTGQNWATLRCQLLKHKLVIWPLTAISPCC